MSTGRSKSARTPREREAVPRADRQPLIEGAATGLASLDPTHASRTKRGAMKSSNRPGRAIPATASTSCPYGGVARVWHGDLLLAESTSAIRVIGPITLNGCTSKSDVDARLLTTNDHHTICPFKGEADYCR